jgi:predicted dehydrogenase
MIKKNKIRWGILATGNIANQFAMGLEFCENSELVAVASRNPDRGQAFARQHGVPIVYQSYEELASSDEVDVIYIATPHHLHHPNAKMCLGHGKHVLCEKPLTLNATLSRELIELAKLKECFLMEALWTRFIPTVQHALEMVQSGKLGALRHMTADFGFKVKRDPQHRLFNPEYGGGSLLDVGIYPLALAYFFLGKPNAIKSHLQMGPTHVDEQCSMNLDYGHASAQLFSSITVETKLECCLVGELGSLEFIGPLFAPTGLIYKAEEQEEIIDLSFEGNGYQFEAMAVEKCLIQGETQSSEMGWKSSLELAEMMDLVLATADTGEVLSGSHHPEFVMVS